MPATRRACVGQSVAVSPSSPLQNALDLGPQRMQCGLNCPVVARRGGVPQERQLKASVPETLSKGICTDTPVETVLIISSFLQSSNHTRRANTSPYLSLAALRTLILKCLGLGS
ncbi:unnamed protein product [Leuciscus chuanchicus]